MKLPTHWRRPGKSASAGLILLGAILLFSLLKATKPDAAVQTQTEPVYTVRTQTVEPAALAPLLSLYGTAVAPGQARLTAAVAADVQAVHALPGDAVPAGELLIQLDAAEAEITLTQARSELYQAEAQLAMHGSQRLGDEAAVAHERQLLSLAERAVARAVELRRRGALSEAQLDETKQNLERQKLAVEARELTVTQAGAVARQRESAVLAAEARLQRAELDLQRTRIHAPFDAAVLNTHVAVGDRVAPGAPLIDVYDPRAVEIRAQVPSRHLAPLRQAQADGLPLVATVRQAGRRFPARFVRLAASGGGGGQDAYFAVDDIAVDSNVSLELALPPEPNAIAVPFNAVYDLARVFRVVDGRLESVTIEQLGDYRPVGGEGVSLLIRSEQLRDGDQIVLTQLPNAVTGLKVQTVAQ